ncbi:hypothetical protein [Nocardiopsis tropica]|uniref:Uncharacterized protein n=1 Tax=Nocardiopsis tropica TaxID=109330 RepID=A0ABU7KLX8_9ACTN|nr:hypothetical protein [Nocardiopsis umidischolae]MEE2050298.1 hypothetical protein [Nocardiopsis umidischolae]
MHASPRVRALTPEKKVTAAGLTGAAVAVLIWAAGLAGLDLPAEVAAGIVALVAAAAGWLAPHTRRPDLGEG